MFGHLSSGPTGRINSYIIHGKSYSFIHAYIYSRTDDETYSREQYSRVGNIEDEKLRHTLLYREVRKDIANKLDKTNEMTGRK